MAAQDDRLHAGVARGLTIFHIIYGVVAACGLASFLLALWVLRHQTEASATPRGRTLAAVLTQFKTGVREILMDRRVFLTSNIKGVQNLSLGALEAFLPIYAAKMAHLSAF